MRNGIMAKIGWALVIGFLATTATAFAQECLHGPSETAAQKTRREQALKLAHQINLAQTTIVGPGAQAQKYQPLAELRNIPPAPQGFAVQFLTDGVTYTFSIKDRLDACHYAIFSDQDKQVYEAIPSTKPVVVPVKTN